MALSHTFTFDTCAVRVRGTVDQPLFHARDVVCGVLGIASARNKIASLQPAWKAVLPVATRGGVQDCVFLTEPGLYEVIMTTRSRAETVVRFRRWVCSEVLPAIRRTGAYQMPAPQQAQLRLAGMRQQQFCIETALANFRDDAALMLMVTERLKQTLGGNVAGRDAPRLLPLSVALEERGHSPPAVRRQRAKIGRVCAAAYRERFGRGPRKTTQNVDGRPCQVNAYDRDELAFLLPLAEGML